MGGKKKYRVMKRGKRREELMEGTREDGQG